MRRACTITELGAAWQNIWSCHYHRSPNIGDQSLTATTATINTVAQIHKIMDTVHGVWVFFTPIPVVNE